MNTATQSTKSSSISNPQELIQDVRNFYNVIPQIRDYASQKGNTGVTGSFNLSEQTMQELGTFLSWCENNQQAVTQVLQNYRSSSATATGSPPR